MIQTDKFSKYLRSLCVDLNSRRLKIAYFLGSQQEQDLTLSPNCKGYGRVHHFRRSSSSSNWPPNPIPIDPVVKALKLLPTDMIKAQVFQLAACNWNCWYCFVPRNLINPRLKNSGWLSPSELVDLYLDLENPPCLIDLSGGHPDLVPEWVPWMMDELKKRGLDKQIFLWSDDNLSTDYFWHYLSDNDLEQICSYPNYARVCCFKGFDPISFSFNTGADQKLFKRQFNLFKRFLDININLYAYVTLTSPTNEKIETNIIHFIDKLQQLDENLPLRTIPLEIKIFSPVEERINQIVLTALETQKVAIEIWVKELKNRFHSSELTKNVTEIKLKNQRV